MKTLHIVRHGKSSWDYAGISDIDRPLILKGITNNYHMAERTFQKYGKVDLIYSSPANRAIHTAIIFAKLIRLNSSYIRIKDELYESSFGSIFNIIENTPSDINCLMIFGHNPEFTNLVNLFLPDNIDNLPTSGVVTLQFDLTDWSIKKKLPSDTNVDFPKNEYF